MTPSNTARSVRPTGRSARRPVRDPARDKAAERAKLAAARAGAVLQADGLLRLPEVLALVPLAASTWWAGCRAGRFPAPVRIGPRCTCWRAADIRALLERLGSEGDA